MGLCLEPPEYNGAIGLKTSQRQGALLLDSLDLALFSFHWQ